MSMWVERAARPQYLDERDQPENAAYAMSAAVMLDIGEYSQANTTLAHSGTAQPITHWDTCAVNTLQKLHPVQIDVPPRVEEATER